MGKPKISFFGGTGPYGALSNFYVFPRPIAFDIGGTTLSCASSEHAFQAAKFIYPGARTTTHALKVAAARTPLDAKNLGGRQGGGACDPDWDARRVKEMRAILRRKFSECSEACAVLVATKGSTLWENSPYDAFWGVGKDGKGKNMLGVLLMEVREEILAKEK